MARSIQPNARALFLAAAVFSAVAGTETVSAFESPASCWLLGPLPAPASQPESRGPLAPASTAVSEIDPHTSNPDMADGVELIPGIIKHWNEVEVVGGTLSLEVPGVYWLGAAVGLDRFSELSVSVEGVEDVSVFIDGWRLEREGREGAVSMPLHRGTHDLLIRLRSDRAASVTLRTACQPPARLTWNLGGPRAPASYQEARRLVACDGLAVDSSGSRIARRLTRRLPTGDATQREVGVLDAEGNLLASWEGFGDLKPMTWEPHGNRLVLVRTRDGRSDLLVFDAATGDVRTVIRDEPDLNLVEWHPAGSHLLLASSRGVTDPPEEESAPRRRRALREKVTDYNTGPHLHLIELRSGARRRLTQPGDWVLDGATFTPDGSAVVYARTVPRGDRPWFATEIRELDLSSTEDRMIATVVGGWESRVAALSVSPDGRRLAFLGPPAQVGDDGPGHNVLQTAAYVLDLETGTLDEVSRGASQAFTLRDSDGLVWTRDGNGLVVAVTDRTTAGVARIVEGPSGWTVTRLPGPDSRTARRVALSRDGRHAAVVASSPDRPEQLYLLDTEGGAADLVEAPNSEPENRWLLAPVRDASFAGPSGDRIDAWWYEPAIQGDRDKVPLVVYYYGGATPVMRRFTFDHQFLAANGYAVLVINPRGALGAGQAFADSHVNDWGLRSSADVLAGVDHFLAGHPEIDGSRVGIYGGSYGGFLTAYLLTVTDRFKAAVDLFGISNLASYWGDGVWGYTYGDVATTGSFPWNAPEVYAGRSPLFRADRITTPLLLLHGMDDVNVPAHESEQLYTALRVLDREVELVLFPGEDHGISGHWSNRAEHRTMMLEWFDMYLKNQPDAWEKRWATEAAP